MKGNKPANHWGVYLIILTHALVAVVAVYKQQIDRPAGQPRLDLRHDRRVVAIAQDIGRRINVGDIKPQIVAPERVIITALLVAVTPDLYDHGALDITRLKVR
jgi:hypothetical protein